MNDYHEVSAITTNLQCNFSKVLEKKYWGKKKTDEAFSTSCSKDKDYSLRLSGGGEMKALEAPW